MDSLLPKHFRASIASLAIFLTLTSLPHANSEAMKGDEAVDTALSDFNSKHYDAALSALSPALEANPRNAEALNLKGAILTKQKKYDALLEKQPLLTIQAHLDGNQLLLETWGLPLLSIPLMAAGSPSRPEMELCSGGKTGSAELTVLFPEGRTSFMISGLHQLVPLHPGRLPFPPEHP